MLAKVIQIHAQQYSGAELDSERLECVHQVRLTPCASV
jgi:hypothetical protein